jgi:hypothetical protein
MGVRPNPTFGDLGSFRDASGRMRLQVPVAHVCPRSRRAAARRQSPHCDPPDRAGRSCDEHYLVVDPCHRLFLFWSLLILSRRRHSSQPDHRIRIRSPFESRSPTCAYSPELALTWTIASLLLLLFPAVLRSSRGLFAAQDSLPPASSSEPSDSTGSRMVPEDRQPHIPHPTSETKGWEVLAWISEDRPSVDTTHLISHRSVSCAH